MEELGVSHFEPLWGQPGCAITVHGSGFAPDLSDNRVWVDGEECLVVSASSDELLAITPRDVESGAVEVATPGRSATGPQDFTVTGYPAAGSEEDGPPIFFEGTGHGSTPTMNPIGELRVLVVPLQPNNASPVDPSAARQEIVEEWAMVKEYYRQASYGRTDIRYDVLDEWTELDGPQKDFVDRDQIVGTQWIRIFAQAAQAGLDAGRSLDDYDAIAVTLFTGGVFVRGFGGWPWQDFNYPGKAPSKKLVTKQPLFVLAVGEVTDWARTAHELGHCLVPTPTVSGDGSATFWAEDIYGSGLEDPSAATARDFDLMGNDEVHPLFSGFHMDRLGYYEPANIHELTWDRNSFRQEFELVAHGLSEDADLNRLHLLKIKIAAGLIYYVEVRQRPDGTAQVCDERIPLPFGGTPNQGGVIVTSVITGTLHTNQQSRFITLLHGKPMQVLAKDDVAEDPARRLRITVVDDVQDRPLVCRVRVEWEQTPVDDPKGAFDLRIEPWDASYQTPDLWIDRDPLGKFDNPLDTQGRPTGNGDRPEVGKPNWVYARVHASGAVGAKDVRVVFYAVTPPGVGDNGNWAPIGTQLIPEIPPNGYKDSKPVIWVPVVDKHTCLMVAASPQPGEISGGNNFAQENIATFFTPGGSPVKPVISRVAIRNPLFERSLIHVNVYGVPYGWRVHFPHAWVWLDGKAEKHLDLIVMPFLDYWEYEKGELRKDVEIGIGGYLLRHYGEPTSEKPPPPSRLFPIGGVLNDVKIRREAEISLVHEPGSEPDDWTVALGGSISPSLSGQRIVVELLDPIGRRRVRETATDVEGYFRVAFDLRYEPSPEADHTRWQKADELMMGTYRARASIFNATEAADATSDFVFIPR